MSTTLYKAFCSLLSAILAVWFNMFSTDWRRRWQQSCTCYVAGHQHTLHELSWLVENLDGLGEGTVIVIGGEKCFRVSMPTESLDSSLSVLFFCYPFVKYARIIASSMCSTAQ